MKSNNISNVAGGDASAPDIQALQRQLDQLKARTKNRNPLIAIVLLIAALALVARWAGVTDYLSVPVAGIAEVTGDAPPIEPDAVAINAVSTLFGSFLHFLEVIMAISFGVIVYLQWRDTRRQDEMQTSFLQYVEGVTDSVQNSSNLISTMRDMMAIQTSSHEETIRINKQIEDQERERNSYRDVINNWAREFNRRFSRHQRESYGRLERQYDLHRRDAATHSITSDNLCPEFSLLGGIFYEKVETQFAEAKLHYEKALNLALPNEGESEQKVNPALVAAIRRNYGSCLHYLACYDEAQEQFDKAVSEFPEGSDLNRRLSLQTQLQKARTRHANNEIDDTQFANLLTEICAGFSDLEANIKPERPTWAPVDIVEHRTWLAYWHVSALLDLKTPEAAQEATNVLANGRLRGTWSIINAIRIGHAEMTGGQVDSKTVHKYIEDCRVELAQQENLSDRITLCMRLMRFHSHIGDTDGVKYWKVHARGELEKLRGTGERGVHVFSVVSNSFIAPDDIERELEELA